MRIKKIAPILVQTPTLAMGAVEFGGRCPIQAVFTFPARNGLTIDRIRMLGYAYENGGTPEYIIASEATALLEFKNPQGTDVIGNVVQTTHPVIGWDTASSSRFVWMDDKIVWDIGLEGVAEVWFAAGTGRLTDATPNANYKGQIHFLFEYSYDG